MITKKFVVWHGTAGLTSHSPVSGTPGKATTSIDGWNRNADRVGAPWLVDPDGTICKTFEDYGGYITLASPARTVAKTRRRSRSSSRTARSNWAAIAATPSARSR